MSLGLIKPGASVVRRHPKTGVVLEPLYVTKAGKVVWPQMGASSDDPDDPGFTGGEGDDDEDDDSDDDDDEKPPARKPKPRKSTRQKDDDNDSDDDDEDQPSRPERQAARYRTRLRAEEARNRELSDRLRALEDKDREPDEVASRDLSEARSQVESLTEVNRIMTAQLAFFKTPTGIEWVDASDAFALAEREGLFDDVIDEDGNVDTRELRRGLRELAKRKKYLVRDDSSTKARGRKNTDDDEDEDDDQDDEPRSRRSASSMNTSRRGKRGTAPSRADLAKKFPILGRN